MSVNKGNDNRLLGLFDKAALYSDNETSSFPYKMKLLPYHYENNKERIPNSQNIVQNGILKLLETCLNSNTEALYLQCLNIACQSTRSKFGFLGEINFDGKLGKIFLNYFDEGQNHNKHEITDRTTRCEGGFEIRDVCNSVLKHGKASVFNEYSTHGCTICNRTDRGSMTSFLGTPLKRNGNIISVIGTGNSKAYCNEDLESMELLAPAIAGVLEHKNIVERLKFKANILDVSNEAIIILNQEYKIVYWNLAAEKLYGKQVTEALDKIPLRMFKPIWSDEQRIARDTRFRQGKTIRCDYLHYQKDGSSFWIESTAQAFFDDEGNVSGYIFINRNVTDRKQMERLKEWFHSNGHFYSIAQTDLPSQKFNELLLNKYVNLSGYQKEMSDTTVEHIRNKLLGLSN